MDQAGASRAAAIASKRSQAMTHDDAKRLCHELYGQAFVYKGFHCPALLKMTLVMDAICRLAGLSEEQKQQLFDDLVQELSKQPLPTKEAKT